MCSHCGIFGRVVKNVTETKENNCASQSTTPMNQQQYQQLIAFVKSRIVHSNNHDRFDNNAANQLNESWYGFFS
jgi:ribosomal protein S20